MSSTSTGTWVAYVGPFEYPWGRAASRRVHFVAKAIAMGGRDVVVLAADRGSQETELVEILAGGRISVARVAEFPEGNRIDAARDWLYRMGRRSVEWLELQPTMPSHVIIYGGSLPYLRNVKAWADAQGVAVVLDIVEWYDPSAYRGRHLSPLYWAEVISRRLWHRSASGIIAISKLLETHYRAAGVAQVVRVPPGIDPVQRTNTQPTAFAARPQLSLVYAGVPGAKDDVVTVIRVVEALARDGANIQFTLVGPSRPELELIVGNKLTDAIQTPGRVEQSAVRHYVSAADFTILMRPNRRSSNAGFPTKFVESMAVGTPVIANLTSDLGDYLVDRETGIIVGGTEATDIEASIRVALDIGVQDRIAMRAKTLEMADHFRWDRAVEPISKLLSDTTRSSAT